MSKLSSVSPPNSTTHKGPDNHCQGRILRGLWGPGPPGVTKGRQKKKEKRKGKERERGEKRRKKEIRKKKGKKEEARKKKERKLNQYDERGTMQFQVQAGAPGKKRSGAPN